MMSLGDMLTTALHEAIKEDGSGAHGSVQEMGEFVLRIDTDLNVRSVVDIVLKKLLERTPDQS